MSLFSNDGDDVLFGKEDDDDGSSVGTPTMGGRRVRRVRWHTGDTPLEGSRRNSFDGGDGLGGEFMWSKEAEKRVVRKFDWYLVGWMAALYTMSFLDRSSEFSPILSTYTAPTYHLFDNIHSSTRKHGLQTRRDWEHGLTITS